MKKSICIIAGLIVSLTIQAQTETFEVFYGVNLAQFYTGSGHGSGYIVNTNLQKGRKSLEMGVIFQEDKNRISGGDVKYKVFLGQNAFLKVNHSGKSVTMRPYLHYNCIYHSSVVHTPDYVPSGAKKSSYPDLPASPGTVATMEHFAGFGLQLFVLGNFCADASAGFGTYIGSINRYEKRETFGIHHENHGFVLAFEFGLGYKFGI